MSLLPQHDVPIEQRLLGPAVLIFTFVVVFLVSLALCFGIIVPLAGALVRFRANYTRKGVQLDLDEGEDPHTEVAVHSYFGMLARVKRIEGRAGLYKGLMPTLLFSIPIVALGFLLVGRGITPARGGTVHVPQNFTVEFLAYSAGMILISIPIIILTNRSITTTHKLPYFGLKKSLGVLLTSQERSRPWILYLTPGLLVSEVLQVTLVWGMQALRNVIVGALHKLLLERTTMAVATVAVYFATAGLGTLVLTPLQMISTRVTVQPNRASSASATTSNERPPEYQEENVALEGGAEFSIIDSEDVLVLRDGLVAEPYLGLIDCGKKIVKEEGWMTLYRAWWITLLGTFAASLLEISNVLTINKMLMAI